MEELDLLKIKIKDLICKEDYQKYIIPDMDIMRLKRVLREMKKYNKMNEGEKEKEIEKITKDYDKQNETNYYERCKL